MKKSILLCCVALLLTQTTKVFAQQDKVAVLAFTTSSNEALITFNQALELIDFGETKQARNLFEKALQQDPRFAAADLFLAGLANSPQEFIRHLDKAKSQLEKSSDWEKLYYQLMESFVTNNQNQRLEAAQKMVAMFPANARSYSLLGEAYAAANDVANARKVFQKAIETEPQSPLGYRGLADSYLFQEPRDFRKAEQNAAKVVSLKPVAASYILLGDTYRAQNNLQKAKNAYAKAADANPEDATALIKRGHAYTFLGDYDKARADYTAAEPLDVAPTSSIMYKALTWLYQGQPANGLQALIAESGKLDTKDPAKTIQAQYELLNAAARIAFHINDRNTLDNIIPLLEPLNKEMMNGIESKEAQANAQSEMLYNKTCAAIAHEDYNKAEMLLNEMKTTLDPIQNRRKLEGYEFLQGMISYRKKDFTAAQTHFDMADKDNVYTKYWMAKTFEAAGRQDKANALYKDIAQYNFNSVDYALIRHDLKSKM